MKINRSNYSQFINQLYKKNHENKYVKRENIKDHWDRIELSKTSKDIQNYIEKVKQLEGNQREKIARIKQTLQSGTYQISSKELAGIIMEQINRQKGKEEK